MHRTRSPSAPVARKSDPFVAGYVDDHPALPGPYAELPMRHYLAARDPMTGMNPMGVEPAAPVVWRALLSRERVSTDRS
jgi:hypothetical protein